MTRVNDFTDFAVNVSLLEYNNLNGSLAFSELSNKRLRQTPHKILKVGQCVVLHVLRVDQKKAYVDLSRNNITPKDKEHCEQNFNKCKVMQSILSHVGSTLHISLEDLYKKIVWPLYHADHTEEVGHPLETFKKAESDPSVLSQLDITPEVKAALLKGISHRLGVHEVKVQALLEVTCFAEEGIDAIIRALTAGEQIGTKEEPIKIVSQAAPLYVMTTTTLVPEQGIALLAKAIAATKAEIEARHGGVTVKEPPAVVVS